MNNRKIENIIRDKIDKITPSSLDNILSKCNELPTEKNFPKKRLSFSFLIPVCAVLVVIFLVSSFMLRNQSVDSRVFLDVNPSIELKVGKNNRIKDAISYNKDGKKILSDMNLENTDLKVGINAIIGAMLKFGYISEYKNSVLVTVDNKDVKVKENLQKEISNELNDILAKYNISSSIIIQNFDDSKVIKEKSQKYGLSTSKTEFINKIIDSKITRNDGTLYKFEDLVDLSINELSVILNSKNKQLKNVTIEGTASTKLYVDKEILKNVVASDSNCQIKSMSELDIELDYENGRMIYEIDFLCNHIEYEYEVDASNGKIIDKKVEQDDDYKSNNGSNITDNKSVKTNSSNRSTNPSPKVNNVFIGREKAKKIAFSNALVTNVRDLDIEFEQDNGKYIYEISFESGNKEYEYKIDALTGKILYKEIDD